MRIERHDGPARFFALVAQFLGRGRIAYRRVTDITPWRFAEAGAS